MNEKFHEIDFPGLADFLKGEPLLVSTDFGMLPVNVRQMSELFHPEHKNTVIVKEKNFIYFIENIICK